MTSERERRDAAQGSLDVLKGVGIGLVLAIACWALLLLALWAFAEVVT